MDIGNKVMVARDIPRDVLFGDGKAEIAIPAGERGVIVQQAVWRPSQVVQLDSRDVVLFIPDEYLTVVE